MKRKLLSMLSVASFFLMNAQNTDYNKDFKFLEYDIEKLQKGYQNKEYKISDVVKSYLERIEKVDKNGAKLNSVITLNPDAMKIADSLDQVPLQLRKGALFGVPVLLKDNIDTKDKMPNTAGSLAMKDSFPLHDAFLVEKLRKSGAIIIGKTNLSEWANFRGIMSVSGWSGNGGLTKNPYDLTRNTCGSSAGSGAAISANLGIFAIGTETNGSIICPSSVNGIVGLKPTVGLVSRSGIIPISVSQDTAGPMTRTVKDAAIALGVLTGVDEKDRHTLASKNIAKTDYTSFLKLDGLKGKRIGYSKKSSGNVKVDALFQENLKFLEKEGAILVEISEEPVSNEIQGKSFDLMILEYKDGLNNYFKSLGPNAKIKSVEELIAFNKNNPEEMKYFKQEFLEMTQATKGMQDENYAKLLKEIQEGSRKNGIDATLKKYQLDALIAASTSPAWKTDMVNGDNYIFEGSGAAAIAGYPSITVPMGNIDGLPVGILFYAEAWSEGKLINMAYTFEQKNPQRLVPQFKN